MRPLHILDTGLSRLAGSRILALAVGSVAVVGLVSYLIGYEVSMSLFYVVPVALAAWYAGRWPGISIALLSCVSWYIADLASGNQYSHPAIPVWNSLVRLGFFLVSGLLVAALRNTLENERRLARVDALTGLYGRRAFEEQLEHDLALSQRMNTAVTLAYLDIDDFKAVNDTHGHAAGDRVLQTVGRIIGRHIRRADTAARLGGDEFALLLPDTDPEGARRVVSNLAHELELEFRALDRSVSCSIGVVTFRESPLSSAAAVAAADRLMYAVKRQGKGAVAYRVVDATVSPPDDSEVA